MGAWTAGYITSISRQGDKCAHTVTWLLYSILYGPASPAWGTPPKLPWHFSHQLTQNNPPNPPHAQRLISKVILDSVKLAVNTGYLRPILFQKYSATACLCVDPSDDFQLCPRWSNGSLVKVWAVTVPSLFLTRSFLLLSLHDLLCDAWVCTFIKWGSQMIDGLLLQTVMITTAGLGGAVTYFSTNNLWWEKCANPLGLLSRSGIHGPGTRQSRKGDLTF